MDETTNFSAIVRFVPAPFALRVRERLKERSPVYRQPYAPRSSRTYLAP